jgi:hypothetical protein
MIWEFRRIPGNSLQLSRDLSSVVGVGTKETEPKIKKETLAFLSRQIVNRDV